MDDDASDFAPTRRTYLTLTGFAATTALAGCLGGGDSADSGANAIEPTSVPDDASCSVCKMTPAKFPDYNAQLAYDGHDHQFFCSTGCMTAFAAVPENFDEAFEGASPTGAWVHDHESKELVDGQAASYVLEMNPDRVDDPMMTNPLAFSSRDDAVAYVDQYDDLSAEDIVAFDDFDRELAEQYRAKFF
ncbi:nitrous oxide reductase accessory protein NosL [Haloferax sp. YSMS24]|uniref:nitrous oxide reductase accessory protein NosL n=1 Tax=Haloferax sp. YSMS24 TaxID=3388425 RepID=UPI00398C8419